MRQPRSIDVLSSEARDQLTEQLRHFERLDAKAGVLLGFAGLFVALAPESRSVWIYGARLAAVGSATFALLTFLGRDYPTLDLLRLRTVYLGAEASFTRLALLDAHVDLLEEARKLTGRKALRMKVATSALLVAITLAVGEFLVG